MKVRAFQASLHLIPTVHLPRRSHVKADAEFKCTTEEPVLESLQALTVVCVEFIILQAARGLSFNTKPNCDFTFNSGRQAVRTAKHRNGR